jgi:hypothetical protein
MELLLHSLSELRELIFSVIDAASPRSLVEIGSETGGFTVQLVSWAKENGARLVTIDPSPDEAVRELSRAHVGTHVLVLEKSPSALARCEKADLYLIDGDHNFSVVSRELELVSREAIVFLHDVGWPCARRDQYYSPADLPPGDVHPHTFDEGVRLDDPGTVPYGFRGEGAFAFATTEGGPRNGVLTAVESFLEAHDGYDFYLVPAVFGLGVLVPRAHPAAGRIGELLRPYDRNPLVARLEENRLRNYLQVIALQDRVAFLEADRERAQTRALEAERRLNEIEARLAELESRPLVRVAEVIGRAFKRPSS